MKAGQIITLVCALLLLLPGLCFTGFGVYLAGSVVAYIGFRDLGSDSDKILGLNFLGLGIELLLIGAVLLGVVWFMVRAVIRWNRTPGAPKPPGIEGS